MKSGFILCIGILFMCCLRAENVQQEIKVQLHPVQFFPSISEREKWTNIQKRAKVESFSRQTIAQGEKLLGKDIPVLPAAMYMDYQRNGQRRPWEAYYFASRMNMETLVLAEAFEHKGRFMDDIINHLWAILNEPTWCVSAHAGLSPADPLPDFEFEKIDLFSAETSSRLATVLQLMEKELNAVSPTLVKKMKRVLMERAILPVEKHLGDFWWRAGVNNWTPWICSNLINTANTVLKDDPKRLSAFLNLLHPCMERYYARFHADGACEEGAMYWGVSVGRSMLYYLYVHAMTDGQVSVFKDAKYCRMCEFIADNWLGEKYITTFADSTSTLSTLPCGYAFKVADYLHSDKLINFIRAFQEPLPISHENFDALIGTVASIFWSDDLPFLPRKDFSVYYENLQLLLIRSGKIHFAAIGNRNAGGHHHLDIGGFIIAVDGREFVIDLGRVTYTKDTFSSNRFQNPFLNSLYHNVPVFDGKSQGNGPDFAAKDVSYKQDGTKHIFSMDLTSAYPSEIRLKKCIRTFVFDTKEQTISVTDTWNADKPIQYSMTLFMPEQSGTTALSVKSTLTEKTDNFNVSDPGQKKDWGKILSKTEFHSPKAISGTHTVIFSLNRLKSK